MMYTESKRPRSRSWRIPLPISKEYRKSGVPSAVNRIACITLSNTVRSLWRLRLSVAGTAPLNNLCTISLFATEIFRKEPNRRACAPRCSSPCRVGLVVNSSGNTCKIRKINDHQRYQRKSGVPASSKGILSLVNCEAK